MADLPKAGHQPGSLPCHRAMLPFGYTSVVLLFIESSTRSNVLVKPLLGGSPIVVDITALHGLISRGVIADRAPDLRVELSGRNIIAEELVVYNH